jgi:FAD:protein FMN transferase
VSTPAFAAMALMALAAVPAGFAAAGEAAPPERVERRLSAMGTDLVVVVEAADRAVALAASERAVRAVAEVEARLSTWRQDGELARLNAAPVGAATPLSPELAAELAAATACRQRTGGAFDPGVGALVAAWGLRVGGRLPSEEELAAAVEGSGLRHLGLTLPAASGGRFASRRAVQAGGDEQIGKRGELGEGAALAEAPAGRRSATERIRAGGGAPEGTGGARAASAVRLHPGLRIEEGGFGKGAGLAAAAAVLEPLLATGGAARAGAPSASTPPLAEGVRIESASLDLGGQVMLVGDPASAPGRTLAVADPRDRGRRLLALAVDAGSLATSGNSERGFEVDGRRYGHVLDPRTGRPAADFGSLTVWAADPLLADCLSTGLYVMGPDRALRWAAGEPDVEVLVVETWAAGEPRVRATAGLAARAAPLVPGLEIETVSPYTTDGRHGRSPHEPRAGAAVPWEGRPSARSKPTSPEGGTGFRGEYR